MGHSLKELCTPRPEVFDPRAQDEVLDLERLRAGTIDAARFFDRSHVTAGMRDTARHAFARFAGERESSGVILLSQSMGGGKSHCLITMGLLAENPIYRKLVLGEKHEDNLGKVRVVAFSGRQTDWPTGIWGAVAEQLGKKEALKDYYAPLKAPGQETWIALLEGEPLVILLDELPFYLDDAQSKSVGNSDLARVTQTAIANLLVALQDPRLGNVCLVVADLTAAYEKGGQVMQAAFTDLGKEFERLAVRVEPVSSKGDELYEILRRQLFESLPAEGDKRVEAIVRDYAAALAEAVKAGVAAGTPERFVGRALDSWPFHPVLRTLYRHFKENPGFQQTRGLIRLARGMVRHAWETDLAATEGLIMPYWFDVEGRDREMVVAVRPKLRDALDHDVANAEDPSVAETVASETGVPAVCDAAALLHVASLAAVPNAHRGLSIPETVGVLVAPTRPFARLTEAIELFASRAFYLHKRDGGEYEFRDEKNLEARVTAYESSYLSEDAEKEVRLFLSRAFAPGSKEAYQKLEVFPNLGDLELSRDAVTLVIQRPLDEGRLHEDLRAYWAGQRFGNRLLVLTGTDPGRFESLLRLAKRVKAVKTVISEMVQEGTASSDPAMAEATAKLNQDMVRFRGLIQSCFTRLYMPAKGDPRPYELMLGIEGDFEKGGGEGEVVKHLATAGKLYTRLALESPAKQDELRQYAEAKLFIGTGGKAKATPWNDILANAASKGDFPLVDPAYFQSFLGLMEFQGHWRSGDTGVEVGPFTRQAVLNASAEATESGYRFTAHRVMEADEPRVAWAAGDAVPVPGKAQELTAAGDGTFTAELPVPVATLVAYDKTGKADPSTPQVVRAMPAVVLERDGNKVTLRALPKKAEVLYTLDGSDPQSSGIPYSKPFAVDKDATLLAVAREGEAVSPVLREAFTETKHIEPNLPLAYTGIVREPVRGKAETRGLLVALGKQSGTLHAPHAELVSEGGTCEVRFDGCQVDAAALLDALGRAEAALPGGGSASMNLYAQALGFGRGADFEAFARETGTAYGDGDWEQ